MIDERPFHETIVDAIADASFYELASLGRLIIKTKIPENHAAIIAAWEKASSHNNLPDGVVANLLQKQEAAKKAKQKEAVSS
ncbi:MAG: hypothetical protein HYY99_01845 [Candidatus Colwellbacteria bacterium]|nr:hypothetical protein [Candidatus Colwellbacteria bacterium]